MRYFIECFPVEHRVQGGWSKTIHLWDHSSRTICGQHLHHLTHRDAENPVTCKKCLAILEKQGKLERKEGEDG